MELSETFSEAINSFYNFVQPWELTKNEKKLLNLAQSGNAGAFCDLLASQGLENKDTFNAFYAEINQDGIDLDSTKVEIKTVKKTIEDVFSPERIKQRKQHVKHKDFNYRER